MSRSRIVTFVAAGVTAAAAAVAAMFADVASLLPETKPSQTTPAQLVSVPAAVPASVAAMATGAIQKALDAADRQPQPAGATFDVVRIDPDGASVFAGRAMPSAEVKIMANGQTVVAVKANESGEWSAVTDHRFVPGQYKLALSDAVGAGASRAGGQEIEVSIAPGTRPAQIPLAKPVLAPRQVVAAATPRTRIVSDIEAMVTAAKQGDTSATVPMPILFKFRETAFTPEGEKAAALLAEYLKLRRLDSITLSGHADERGTPTHNLELSRQRLDAVVRHLRAAGYTGQFEVQPKGDTEPFKGVPRQALAKEEAWQLDRRVELHVR
jgi:outer membrane protein OmpA-like peptidoglycan-associated protein